MPKRLACALLAMLLPAHAEAAPQRYLLAPGTVQLGFRAYGLGMLPIDGNFTRFEGTLVLDDADPATCTMSLRAEAASLRLPTQVMTADALGPDLLDVAHHPDFRVEGSCTGPELNGTLLLHGVNRPVTMAVTIASGRWQAIGTIHRPDWGMGARPLLAGPEVRISIVAGLPTRHGDRR